MPFEDDKPKDAENAVFQAGSDNSCQATEVMNMHYIGKINKKVFENEFGQLVTDEVVLTDERKQHILDRHSNDFELLDKYAKSILETPEFILKDEKNANTTFMIKHIEDTNLNIVLKLAVYGDDKHPKIP